MLPLFYIVYYNITITYTRRILCMNYKKRRNTWQKEVNEGIKDYEKKTGVKYDYYGEVSRRESMKTPKEKSSINYSKIIRFMLFIFYVVYQLKSCSII